MTIKLSGHFLRLVPPNSIFPILLLANLLGWHWHRQCLTSRLVDGTRYTAEAVCDGKYSSRTRDTTIRTRYQMAPSSNLLLDLGGIPVRKQ